MLYMYFKRLTIIPGLKVGWKSAFNKEKRNVVYSSLYMYVEWMEWIKRTVGNFNCTERLSKRLLCSLTLNHLTLRCKRTNTTFVKVSRLAKVRNYLFNK